MLESCPWRPLCTNYSGELTREVMRNRESAQKIFALREFDLLHTYEYFDARMLSPLASFDVQWMRGRGALAQTVYEACFRLCGDLFNRDAVSKFNQLHRL